MSVLPNFADDRDLNSHREESGTTAPLTPQQLEQLTTVGIDIPSLAELRALGDGTLAYRNHRVFVYLRDSALFHVANCERVRAMRASRQAARYVASAGTGVQPEQMRVCQDCLGEL